MSYIIKILKQREVKTHTEYKHDFNLIEDMSCGYSFPVKRNGEINTEDENYFCWKNNYTFCVEHPEIYKDMGIVKNSWNYVENAIGLCSCGREVELKDGYSGACQCNQCGQWYNIFGQALINPEYWEEE